MSQHKEYICSRFSLSVVRCGVVVVLARLVATDSTRRTVRLLNEICSVLDDEVVFCSFDVSILWSMVGSV